MCRYLNALQMWIFFKKPFPKVCISLLFFTELNMCVNVNIKIVGQMPTQRDVGCSFELKCLLSFPTLVQHLKQLHWMIYQISVRYDIAESGFISFCNFQILRAMQLFNKKKIHKNYVFSKQDECLNLQTRHQQIIITLSRSTVWSIMPPSPTLRIILTVKYTQIIGGVAFTIVNRTAIRQEVQRDKWCTGTNLQQLI